MAMFGTFTSSGAAVAAARHPRTTETISSILDELGKAEFARQQKQMREAVLGAMEQGGAPDVMRQNVLSTISGYQPTYSGGLGGFFQRMATPYAQQYGNPLQEQILSSQMSDLFGRKTGIPYGVTPELAAEANIAATKRRVTGRQPKPLKELPEYYGDYSGAVTGYDVKGQYGQRAYTAGLMRTIAQGTLKGFSKESIKRDFDRWWDDRVKFAKPIETQEGETYPLVERRTFTAMAAKPKRRGSTHRPRQTAKVKDTDIRVQDAPDIALDEYWPKLGTKEKKKILQAIDNGYSIDQIVEALKGK